MTRRRTYFEVRPRYTAGSPGMVDEAQARRVAREEWASYQSELSGIYGRAQQRTAMEIGLLPQPVAGLFGARGIVEAVEEHDNHWLVTDVLTGKVFRRDFRVAPRWRRVNLCARCLGAIEKARPSIFVFGSNEAGVHGAGAARAALNDWGAVWGVGIGRAGRSYAIPTKDGDIQTLPLDKVQAYVQAFLAYAADSPDDIFLVTRIGCGLAGFEDKDIAPLFAGAPDNCYLPGGWR